MQSGHYPVFLLHCRLTSWVPSSRVFRTLWASVQYHASLPSRSWTLRRPFSFELSFSLQFPPVPDRGISLLPICALHFSAFFCWFLTHSREDKKLGRPKNELNYNIDRCGVGPFQGPLPRQEPWPRIPSRRDKWCGCCNVEAAAVLTRLTQTLM